MCATVSVTSRVYANHVVEVRHVAGTFYQWRMAYDQGDKGPWSRLPFDSADDAYEAGRLSIEGPE